MKKGITPVISLVLLLLIVVVIVGLAAGQLMGVFSQAGKNIEKSTGDVQERLTKVPKIDRASCIGTNLTVYVRGMGSGTIKENETAVYLGETYLGGNTKEIPGGQIKQLEFDSTDGVSSCSGTVAITGPTGSTDEYQLS